MTTIPTSAFPVVNASLNAASAVLLATAFAFIKRGRVRAHGWTMIAAVVTSTAFLAASCASLNAGTSLGFHQCGGMFSGNVLAP